MFENATIGNGGAMIRVGFAKSVIVCRDRSLAKINVAARAFIAPIEVIVSQRNLIVRAANRPGRRLVIIGRAGRARKQAAPIFQTQSGIVAKGISLEGFGIAHANLLSGACVTATTDNRFPAACLGGIEGRGGRAGAAAARSRIGAAAARSRIGAGAGNFGSEVLAKAGKVFESLPCFPDCFGRPATAKHDCRGRQHGDEGALSHGERAGRYSAGPGWGPACEDGGAVRRMSS